jgi:hypothetical protein
VKNEDKNGVNYNRIKVFKLPKIQQLQTLDSKELKEARDKQKKVKIRENFSTFYFFSPKKFCSPV